MSRSRPGRESPPSSRNFARDASSLWKLHPTHLVGFSSSCSAQLHQRQVLRPEASHGMHLRSGQPPAGAGQAHRPEASHGMHLRSGQPLRPEASHGMHPRSGQVREVSRRSPASLSLIGQIREMRDKLGTGCSPREASLSGFKADSSFEPKAESELGLGWPSFVKGELLIKGRQGARKKHYARLKIAQMFY